MYFSHPFSVTFCQIIIDRNDMDAFSWKCVQISRKCRHKRLTFTCTHLGNTTLVQNNTTDKLYSVMTHTDTSPCCLSYNGISLRKNVVKRLSFIQSVLKLLCFSFQFLIWQRLHRRSKSFDPVYDRINSFQLIMAVGSENLFYNTHIL